MQSTCIILTIAVCLYCSWRADDLCLYRENMYYHRVTIIFYLGGISPRQQRENAKGQKQLIFWIVCVSIMINTEIEFKK